MGIIILNRDEDVTVIKKIKYKEACCASYRTPKGRCYTCPENSEQDPDDDNY